MDVALHEDWPRVAERLAEIIGERPDPKQVHVHRILPVLWSGWARDAKVWVLDYAGQRHLVMVDASTPEPVADVLRHRLSVYAETFQATVEALAFAERRDAEPDQGFVKAMAAEVERMKRQGGDLPGLRRELVGLIEATGAEARLFETPEREDVLARLRAAKERFRAAGVKAMWLFGSVAKGKARPSSDIDIAIEYELGRNWLSVLAAAEEVATDTGLVRLDICDPSGKTADVIKQMGIQVF